MLPLNTSATYTLLIKNNNGTTYMSPTNTGTTFMLPNQLTIFFASLLIPWLIYKLLITLLTNSLGLSLGLSLGFTKLLLFFLLLNQVKGTYFQSISLTSLNLSTIKPTFMSNPNFNSPIRLINCTPNAQQRAQQLGPPPVGFIENYTQPTQGCSHFFVPKTPVTFPPSPTPAPGSSYTIEGVVYNSHATKKVK